MPSGHECPYLRGGIASTWLLSNTPEYLRLAVCSQIRTQVPPLEYRSALSDKFYFPKKIKNIAKCAISHTIGGPTRSYSGLTGRRSPGRRHPSCFYFFPLHPIPVFVKVQYHKITVKEVP